MSTECCHGVQQARKICAAQGCKLPAFVSMACEDCQTEHDHDGKFNLQTRINLVNKIEGISPTGDQDTTLVDSICDSAGDIALRINDITADISRDFEDVCKGLILKPSVEQAIRRLENFDQRLTGANANALAEAIRLKECYSNKEEVNRKASELDRLYANLLERLSTIIRQFRDAKSALLTGRKPPTPRLVRQIHEPNPRAEQPKKPPTVYVPASTPRPVPKKIIRGRLTFTDVADIQPWVDSLNLHVKVVQTVYQKRGEKRYVVCLLGDETGVVEGSFAVEKEPSVRLGVSLDLIDVKAEVCKSHIVIHVKHPGSVFQSDEKVDYVNLEQNISEQEVSHQEFDSDDE